MSEPSSRGAPPTIRDTQEEDLPAILAIHNDAVLTSTALWSFRPVDLADRRAVLEDRRARGFPFLVATSDGAVTGYASFGDFRPHDGYFKTVEHSLYVARDHRRTGIGALLLPALIERARALGKHAMVGGVDAANEASIRLHQAFGFAAVGRLPEVGFKFDRYLDLVFLQKILD